MYHFANATITDWNTRNQDVPSAKGLIAVSFDQRNHGTRMIDELANESWKNGNPRHAQDMFSIFRELPQLNKLYCSNQATEGTARDTSVLMDYLASYTFPNGEHKITKNLVLGVSLGGHAAWSCLLHEPRISAGVVIIGCPDYINLMADRARLSKLPSWTKSDPPGVEILGSEDLPSSFLETVKQYDPASMMLKYVDCGPSTGPLREGPLPQPSESEQQVLRPILTRSLAGKRILNLSGGKDKLVPYHRGELFLNWFKNAISPDGWFGDGGVSFEDIIDKEAAHEATPKMIVEAVRFISETLAVDSDTTGRQGSVRESKI
jgi:pimeloyl-ACP methyl ester carboxylesterase